MSLVSYMVRRALVENLRGATVAGSSVFDSVIDPLDILAANQATPFALVSIEEGTDTGFTDMDIGQSANRSRVIMIDLGVGSAATIDVAGDDGVEQVVVQLAATDAGAELTLDVMARQIQRVFTVPPDPVWGPIWQKMVSHVDEVATRRGLLSDDGQRAAFRQMAITTRVLAEPPHGEIIPVWDQAIAALEANDDPAIAQQGAVIRAAIIGQPIRVADAEWVKRGFEKTTAQAIYLAPFDDVPDNDTTDPPTLAEVIVDAELSP